MAGIYLGSTNLSDATLYGGSTSVTKAYIGSTQVFGTSFSPDDISNLVLWYDISNPSSYPGSGTTIYDLKLVRNASYRDATISGTYTYNAGPKTITKSGIASGNKIGMAANGSYPLSTTSNISYSIWCNISTFYGAYSRIIRSGDNSNSNNPSLARYNGGANYAIYDISGGTSWGDTSVTATTGAWINLTMTVAGTALLLYENGTQIFSTGIDGTSPLTRYLFDIFGSTGTELTTGDFGAAFVYDKTLSPTEVADLYNGTNRY